MVETARKAPAEIYLVGREDQTPDQFLFERQVLKMNYSQPSFPQSPDVIKSRASEVLSENPLVVKVPKYLQPQKEGEESQDAVVEYDEIGRPVHVVSLHLEYKRTYNQRGLIIHEDIRRTDQYGKITEESCDFFYGVEFGNAAVKKILVTPFEIDGDDRRQSLDTFAIDLSDIQPLIPLKKSAPSF